MIHSQLNSKQFSIDDLDHEVVHIHSVLNRTILSVVLLSDMVQTILNMYIDLNPGIYMQNILIRYIQFHLTIVYLVPMQFLFGQLNQFFLISKIIK